MLDNVLVFGMGPASPLRGENAMADSDKPVVLITGGGGNIGRSLAEALADSYAVVVFVRPGAQSNFPLVEMDLSEQASVAKAVAEVRQRCGQRIASVVHLAAYFDFSGDETPAYRRVNIDGTYHLLRALQELEVEQFLYASTMLVHAPCRPGERIDENQALSPGWAYPKSKAEAEEVIRAEHGKIPYVHLRLAGVYDERSAVPTLAQQIARIYERDFSSYLYAGSPLVGQSMVHRDDMIGAFRCAIDRRKSLKSGTAILVGEEEPLGYDAIQDEVGYLIYGVEDWPTLRVPKPAATAGAWLQAKLEPVIPDAFDQGEKPFIKPFMVTMADDHYALDISKARRLLGWEPKHRLKDTLPALVGALKENPAAWYQRHDILLSADIADAEHAGEHPHGLRADYEARCMQEHRSFRWAHFCNIALGTWLVSQPVLIEVREPLLVWSEIGLGFATIVFASLSLSWRLRWARWVCAGIGALVMAIPFLFWTTNSAAYLSDTIVGFLIFALAAAVKPDVGVAPVAATGGPDIPPGWSYNPSSWIQRIPIILLALVGMLIARYLAAYQLGHIEGVWDPFFPGTAKDPQNGTEEIITSFVAEAWPVSDGAVGAYVYALEILTGIIGSRARWRTMPWLVILFGMMIAPLGITSIFFIIIQPISIGTWCTLCLLGAAAMIIQIPYSLDEMLATFQFMRRRVRAGKSWLRVLLFGDRDEGDANLGGDEFDRPAGVVWADMWGGGVSLPWNLAMVGAVGLWLMFTRLTLGVEGDLANVDHLVGSLALTVVSVAAAEVARVVRYLLVPLGVWLIASTLLTANLNLHFALSLIAGAALIGLSLRRGKVSERYASWQRFIT